MNTVQYIVKFSLIHCIFFLIKCENCINVQAWAVCTVDGCGVHFEPYCGRHTNVVDAGLGQCGLVASTEGPASSLM